MPTTSEYQPQPFIHDVPYPFFERYFSDIPADKHQGILDAVASWIGESEDSVQNRTEELRRLLTYGSNLNDHLITVPVYPEPEAAELTKETKTDLTPLLPLANALAEHTPKHLWYPLAVLLAGISHDQLSQEAQERLACLPVEMHAELVPHKQGWYLCLAAERLFYRSFADHRWVHSGPLVVKGIGRLTALPTRSFVTPEGAVFLEGTFYSPIDAVVRHSLRGSLGSLAPQCTIPQGKWVPLRSVQPFKLPPFATYSSPEKLVHALQEAIDTAGSLHNTMRDAISPQRQQSTYEEPMIAGDLQ